MENEEKMGGGGISRNEFPEELRSKKKIKLDVGNYLYRSLIFVSVFLIVTVVFVSMINDDDESIIQNSLTDTEIQELIVVIKEELNLDESDINEIDVMVEIFEFGDTIWQIHTIYRGEDDKLYSKLVGDYEKRKIVDLE